MPTLKPCPFCGKQPVIFTLNHNERWGTRPDFQVTSVYRTIKISCHLPCPAIMSESFKLMDIDRTGVQHRSISENYEERVIEELAARWNKRKNVRPKKTSKKSAGGVKLEISRKAIED